MYKCVYACVPTYVCLIRGQLPRVISLPSCEFWKSNWEDRLGSMCTNRWAISLALQDETFWGIYVSVFSNTRCLAGKCPCRTLPCLGFHSVGPCSKWRTWNRYQTCPQRRDILWGHGCWEGTKWHCLLLQYAKWLPKDPLRTCVRTRE